MEYIKFEDVIIGLCPTSGELAPEAALLSALLSDKMSNQAVGLCRTKMSKNMSNQAVTINCREIMSCKLS